MSGTARVPAAKGLAAEVAELRAQLAEARETLEAIRTGAVDALVVSGPEGDRVFTLEGAETTYRSLVEEINQGALLLAPDGTILFANGCFARLVGAPPEQVTGCSWERFFVASEHHRLEFLLRDSEGGGSRAEISLLTANSDIRPVEVSVTRLRGASTPTFSAVVSDLTERKTAEDFLRLSNERLEAGVERRTAELRLAYEELRLSQERYGLVIEATKDAIWDLDMQTLTMYTNRAFEDMYGNCSTVPDPLGWWAERIHPEDRELTTEGLRAALAGTDETWVCSYRFRRLDGAWADILDRAYISRDSSRKAVRVVGAMLDQTDRIRRENELRQTRLEAENEKRRLEAVMEALPVGVAIIDAEEGLIRANLAFEKVWGGADPRTLVGSPEARGRAVWVDTGRPVAPEEWASVRAARNAETVVGQIIEIERPDGTRVCIMNSAAPVRGAGGRVVGAAVAVQDVTALRKAEELLESEARHLEALVQERTARLMDTIGELEYFSYTLTHDMRAPLRAMIGYGSLLLESSEGVSEEGRRFISRINSAAERMDRLILDALDYNKLVRQHVDLVAIDCEALLRGMLESYPQYHADSAQIVVLGSIPPVMGNEALLTQSFSNLLDNAIKFVEPGKRPEVRIRSENRGERVRIWFEDNGIGIPAELQQRIFLLFQRINPDYEGTGIGLALARKAAERMEGAIGVESEVGVGSRFWLEFRRAPTPPKPGPAERP